MSSNINKLTAIKVRNLKPESKNKRYTDGGGLYLEVTPAGGKYWRLKYRIHDKEKRLSIGVYGSGDGKVSLQEAREARDEAKKLLAQQIDPADAKRMAKNKSREESANTFEAIAVEWLKGYEERVTEKQYLNNRTRLEKLVFPYIGKHGISTISPGDLLTMLRRIEAKGQLETAKRVRTICGQVFKHAIVTGRAEKNPAAELQGVLKSPKPKHLAAITNPDELPELLAAMDSYSGAATTIAALQLAPLLFTRPGEMRHARWADIDLENALWSFTASKTHQLHIVPLPRQAVAILRQQYDVTGNRGNFVFPSTRGKARVISENTVNAALHYLGYGGRQTHHGFRATARTLLVEQLNFPENFIEQQLAHSVRDSNGRAYNRTTFLEQRREMLQAWADYLDEIRVAPSPYFSTDTTTQQEVALDE